jgi:hypothetical protein
MKLVVKLTETVHPIPKSDMLLVEQLKPHIVFENNKERV